MSKTRHRRRPRPGAGRPKPPDGTVTVRTFPVTFLHDVTQARCDAHWHQLTFAIRGHLEVITPERRRFVPADRAVWVPAGVAHTMVMRAPVSMRSLFVAATATALAADRVRTIAVTPLLRELILHATRLGALDEARPEQARLAGVIFDQLGAAEDVPLEIPWPRDARARRFAERVTGEPGEDESIATLARKAGASLRTLERCFLAETGLAVGAWRRRVRLFHALQRLEAGTPVTVVAHDIGYATASAFGQAFAKQFGRSPSGLRRAPRARAPDPVG